MADRVPDAGADTAHQIVHRIVALVGEERKRDWVVYLMLSVAFVGVLALGAFLIRQDYQRNLDRRSEKSVKLLEGNQKEMLAEIDRLREQQVQTAKDREHFKKVLAEIQATTKPQR